MKIVNVEPVTSEDSRVTLEFDSKHIYISSDISPIVCSYAQADRIAELIMNPQEIPDTDH